MLDLLLSLPWLGIARLALPQLTRNVSNNTNRWNYSTCTTQPSDISIQANILAAYAKALTAPCQSCRSVTSLPEVRQFTYPIKTGPQEALASVSFDMQRPLRGMGVYVGCMWAHEFLRMLPGLGLSHTAPGATTGAKALPLP